MGIETLTEADFKFKIGQKVYLREELKRIGEELEKAKEKIK